MKELSIEEKARRYDEAIERANSLLSGNQLGNSWIYKLLPELKESEDERIRKGLIGYFLAGKCENISSYHGISTNDILDWIEKQSEHAKFCDSIQVGDKVTRNQDGVLVNISQLKRVAKQGEQNLVEMKSAEESLGISSDEYNKIVDECIFGEYKSANKVEPKFKVGDWVVNRFGNVWHIDSFDKKNYQVSNGNEYNYFPISKQNDMHLWTIQDAKGGDVLHCWIDGYEFILIYKGIKDGYITAYGHLYQKLKSFSEEPTTMFCRTIQGHFTPATKEQRNLLFQKVREAGYEWDAEKKELKKIEQSPIDVRTTGYWHVEDVEQNPAWNEEDEYQINTILHGLDLKRELYKKEGNKVEEERYNTQYNWLKSLKDRVQPKQGWSEGDENRVNRLIAYFEDKESFTAEDDIVYANWLKYIKERYTWKPSDEQMYNLSEAAHYRTEFWDCDILIGLYDELKKLREV